jgi:DNA-binding response OmpR family regulator
VSVSVLLVDDEPLVAKAVARALQRVHGFDVEVCSNGADAVRLAATSRFDAVLLDWRMPDHSGSEVCRLLRSSGCALPIIVFTHCDSEPEQLEALRAGADDHVAKSASVTLLAERIKSHLRSSARYRVAPVQAVRSGVEVHYGRSVRLAHGGETIHLTRTEERLLSALEAAEGRPIAADDLLRAAWHDAQMSLHTLHTHLSALRRKISPLGWTIENVRGLGYRLRS